MLGGAGQLRSVREQVANCAIDRCDLYVRDDEFVFKWRLN
jgi:hypothetical protein